MKTIDLTRYKVMDELTRLEFATIYGSLAPFEKVDLIKEMASRKWSDNVLSLDVARIIVADKTREARIALARYAHNMIYYTYPRVEGQPPALELGKELLADNDDLITAALYENQHFLSPVMFGDEQKKLFIAAQPIHRLALIRNKYINLDLVLKIYDYDDKEMLLSDNERLALIRALCTNQNLIEESKKGYNDCDHEYPDVLHATFFKNLWKAALKWRDKSFEIPHLTFKNFGVEEDVALEIYDTLKDAKCGALRATILENPRTNAPVTSYGLHNELLKKGLDDKDGMVRYLAAAKVRGIGKATMEELISRGDEQNILLGLLGNKSLDRECMHLLKKAVSASKLEFTLLKDFDRRYESITDAEDAESLSDQDMADLGIPSTADQGLNELQKASGENKLELKTLATAMAKLHASGEKQLKRVSQQVSALEKKVKSNWWRQMARGFLFGMLVIAIFHGNIPSWLAMLAFVLAILAWQ